MIDFDNQSVIIFLEDFKYSKPENLVLNRVLRFITICYIDSRQQIDEIQAFFVLREGAFVEDILKKILELDNKEHELTEEARRVRLDTENKLRESKKEIKEKYIERSESMIRKIKDKADSEVEEQNRLSDEETDRQIAEMSAVAKQNFDSYVARITLNILDR